MQTEIIAKATGTTTTTTANVIDLTTPSVVRLDLNRDRVASMERDGNDLVIRLTDGQTIRIDNFYADQRGVGSDLVLREDNGGQWLANPNASGAGRFTTLTNLDDLLAAQAAQGGGSSFVLPAILGLAGAGGLIAAVASGGDDDDDSQTPTTPPDTSAPARPTALFGSNGGVVTGTGEAGATVRVIGGNGTVLGTGTVGSDGNYSIPLNPPQTNGQQLTVTQTDAAGNVSPTTPVTAPDLTAPNVPTAAINGQGTTITGTGEPGATVTVRNAAGQVLGTATVDAQGNYSLTLTTAQANGGTLTVTQSDAAGNVSPAASVTAPDLTPPAAPTAAIDDEGAIIAGTGEPGAVVAVRDAAGVVLGSTTVDAQGNYSLTLDVPQANGEALTVTQSDAAGNPSPTVPLTAPDITPPAAPTVTIAADGVSVSGTGEPGTTLTIRDGSGAVLGTAVVDAQGAYSLTLANPPANGTMLMATLTDAAGNVSPDATVIISDLEAPTAPTATINGDGTSVTGAGEPGATVNVRDAAGQVLGSAVVAADGSYTLTLSPAQANGETLNVSQTNAQGLSSPAIDLLAPDITAPAIPVATLAGDGASVTGTGEPGATVRVVGANGQVIGTATVGSDGSFTVPVSPALTNGETLSVDQVDGAGNTSPAATLTAADTTAPTAPTAAIDGQGTAVTGTGEPGATVTVRDPAGQVIGTATVDAQGNYTLPLTTPQTAGGTLTVTQSDAAGNASPATTITAPDTSIPDTTPPAAPVVTVSSDGTTLTGTGEPGATVQVTDAAGQPIGTATVGADGSFSVTLPTGTADGQSLSVTQADAAGNVSPATSAATPDLVAPGAPTAALSPDGTVVTGTGEIGATVQVTNADGQPVGTAIVGADGRYSAPLPAGTADGRPLTVTQADAAGNVSLPTTAVTNDTTAPDAPVATVSADGTTLTGTGEAGATIRVLDANGQPVATTTAGPDGSFSVALPAGTADGQSLSVTQTDAAGNVSPATSAATPDLAAPAAPSATLGTDGVTLTGTGEPGATVQVRAGDGTILGTATVAADGNYSATLSSPQANGETLTVGQTDAAGNASPTTTVTAPDTTAPAAPAATVSADGSTLTGTGEPGATVQVTDAAGQPIGTATVAADGSFTVALPAGTADGQSLNVTQADAAGNVSPATSAATPDLVAPGAPTAALSADGSAVTGTGEIGATVQVTNADGQPVGTAIVGADGRYSAALPAGTADGRPLTVTQADAAGNVSPPTTAVTNDTTAPDAPVATVSADGTTLTGTGEAGATIRVVDANGQPVATTTAGPDGSFSVALPAGTADGQSLSVTQTDAAGNVSPATSAATPDLVAPGAPTATLNADGSILTGTGEPGATVQITDANGQPIGTATVAADGSYTIALPAGTATGQSLSVTQADAAGNVSPATNAVTPDLAAPGAPSATLGADGITVSGTGEPGATLEIRAADGTLLGTTTVAGDGSYSATLSGAQANGETLIVTQTDAGGNASPATTITAPDTTAPAAPVATVSADGTTLTGTGEPGATVQVNDANGQPIGTATVAADGSYSVALPAGTADGQSLSVTQTDAAGNVSPATTTATPDLAAPGAPTLAVATDGTSVSGTGEAGATVEIRAADGTLLGSAVVAADGSYSATLTPAQANGEALSATQTDVAGNISPVATTNAPDITAPAAPTVTLAADGASVFGNGEPGATVRIVDGNGTLLGTGVVGADTSFTLTLTPPQVNGQTLSATQTDAAGNISPVSTVGAPDVIAPDAPVATVSVDGTAVTGTGEPFATVTIRTADGTPIGTAVVAADGSFSATLTPAQADGETLSIDQTDRGGNTSPEATLTAPDITAPTGLVAAISGDGSIVTGTGEAGATVTVRDANGATLGTAVVAANGTYSATLTPPQIDSEPLSVVQADVAGNVSAPVALTAPDLTAPLAPTGSVIDGGATLSGTGEAGATVTARSPDGTVLGTAIVAADGSFAVPLTPPQANGETVQFSQADAAGNVSPDVTLVAPDVSAPTGLTAGISGDGSMVTGTGEEGAIVTVRDANGATLGTATVDANGVYMVPLTPPQIDAEALSVVQADAAGNVSTPVPLTAPDLTAPPAPTGTVVDAGATLTGTGEAGATVTVRAADGTILGTAIVAADGSFAVPLATPQANGEALTLVQTDAAGNASPIVAVIAADITAPTGLTATISADGSVVTGTGEAGATVTIRDPAGNAIGTATVAGDGSYAATLTPAQLNGEVLQVTQADAAGNASTPVNPIAPDLTAPAAPLAALAAGGASVTGTGEVGATVTVRAADGSVLGTATVAADGSFTVPLATAQVNGETLTVEQSDAAGNVSPQLGLTAPDITLPTAPTAGIDGTGTVVSGQAEAGATVTVRDPAGTVIGTVTAGANGEYAVAINPPQANGEALTVTQSDAAGNASPPASVTAPDITAPNAPLFTVNGTGTEASGSGEAGTTVTIRDPAGAVIGTTVVAGDGSFTVPLNPAQANGGTLSATLTDAGGNESPVSTAPAPDITAPAAPVAALDVTGTIVSGTGEAGATITVRAGDGTVLGTALVAANGTYAAILSTPQLDSQVLSVSQADAVGNPSPTITVTALDQTAPAAPVATISGDGVTLTGTGEVGATVTITDPVGVVLATVPVAADGSFTVTLTPPLVNGQLLTLTQADAAGNVSLRGTTTAPDLVPNDTPDAPTATVALDGASVTGTGLAGTTITVRDVTGAIIGTTTVTGGGTYTATLTTPLINGETVRVTQTDAEGDVSPPATALAPDLTPPAIPTAAIDATGTVVTGTGEAGATLTVTDAGGAVIGTTIVLANGSYAVVLTPAQIDGQALTVTQTDGAGNSSPSAGVTAPDLTAPLAPAGTVSLDGTTLTGTGEAGATVTIRDVAGTAIGTAVVAADGSFTATLTPAQANGELLTLTQADGAGNVSPIAQVTAPDITAPVGLTAAINGAGTLVSGTGEAGAIVTIRDAGGTVLGTAIVADTGTYAAILTPAQLNGEILSATQVDAAGNAGVPATVTAPDLTAPPAPAGTVSLDGTTLTGTGEAGATVTIRGVDGTVLGTAVVAGDGSFTAPLTPAQANGQLVSLTQADAAGNVSGVGQALAPDITAPIGLTAAINGAGTLITGTGEVGATVTIRDAGGTVLGTTVVAANGTYAAVLTTPQINGQVLTATQADAAGNAGAPAPVTAPDLIAPLAPAGTIAADGTTLTGTGEPGATVTIRSAGGTVLGTALVAGDGSFTTTLTPAQANGQIVSLTQADVAGNVSPVGQATAPDITAPVGLTSTINGVGTVVTGTGEAGATVTVRDPLGNVIGTTVVAANGSYAATLTTRQANGQLLQVTQADAAGNASLPNAVRAPDITAPAAPIGFVNGTGTVVTGTGEAGATVRILDPLGQLVGTAVVAANGSFSATLTTPQANGQVLTLSQTDTAGNASGTVAVNAPDITPPAAPTAVIDPTGSVITGSGEPGARIEVRNAAGTLIGTGTVTAGGLYAVTLTSPQVAGQALGVGARDAAGNLSPSTAVTAPFDISAFDNTAIALVDLNPVQTNQNLGGANYTALVSLGLVNLDAQVLAIPNVQFTVQAGHTLAATFTYDATLNVGVASGYSVVIQRFNGTNWVAVNGSGNSSLLQVGLLNGDLVATADLGPGQYRAFVTFDNTAGVGLLGSLNVRGLDSDFTDVASAVPAPVSGNVITDPGPTGQIDVVSPQTRVESVTLNGVTTQVTVDDTVVTGQWGTLIIDRDGSYTYTPNASAAAIGKVDSFTYTLLDASDNERESARLTISIGSPDITGAPIAVNDTAIATANFTNVVVNRPAAVDTFFSTPAVPLLGSAQTTRVNDSFTVDANSSSTVTLSAVTTSVLAVLPSYTITVTNSAGTVVGTASGTALAGVGGLVGSGISVTLNNLASGTYNYTVTGTNGAPLQLNTNVYVAETVTRLNEFNPPVTTPVSGQLTANDTLGSPFIGIKVLTAAGFQEIGETPITLTGAHGQLVVNETGGYTYTPIGVTYSATDPIDSFTYQLVQPDGQFSTARLDVAVNINNGVAPVFPTATITALAADSSLTLDADVVPLSLSLAADHTTQADAPVVDQPDARLAFSLMEGQGDSIEDVLGRYLDSQDNVTESTTANDNTDFTHAATDTSISAPIMDDPLSYLTVSVDPDQEKLSTMHIM